MNGLRFLPSPRLWGEGGEDRRSEPDEGGWRFALHRGNAPSPDFLAALRSRPLPAREER